MHRTSLWNLLSIYLVVGWLAFEACDKHWLFYYFLFVNFACFPGLHKLNFGFVHLYIVPAVDQFCPPWLFFHKMRQHLQLFVGNFLNKVQKETLNSCSFGQFDALSSVVFHEMRHFLQLSIIIIIIVRHYSENPRTVLIINAGTTAHL